MAFVRPEKKAEGVKFLIYGDAGSGKTPFGLSFPKQALIDSDSGTNFYNYDNVVATTNSLSLKELNEELDELEREEELFNEIETFNIDSITRFHENQEHAALKVVEQRARQAGRLIEGEGLSFKERGIIKLHYDRFFARMLGYAKQGKNLVFIAEKKDKTENKRDAQGNIVPTKVGEMPNMQKNAEYDFDVVVRTYTKNGESYGIVEKDRTGTFKVGEEIYQPNYEHWKEAIEKARKGKKRTKDEIKTFDDSINKEIEAHEDLGETDVSKLISQIMEKIGKLPKPKQTELQKILVEKFGNAKIREWKDEEQLKETLNIVNQM